MGEYVEAVKTIGEVLIAVLAALGTAWGVMRQLPRGEEVKQSVGSLVEDLTKEREELLALLRDQRQENLKLQREIGELTLSRKPPE